MKVAITGLHAVENPSPGVGVARSLRLDRRDLTLIGYAYHPLYTGAFDDVWDEVCLMPNPLELVRDASRSGIAAVIATIDYEIETIATAAWADGTILGLPPVDGVRRVAKTNLPQLALSIGLPVPDTTVISSPDEAESSLVGLGGRGVIKGLVYGAFRVTNPAEGRQIARNLLNTDKTAVVQRWIEGEESGLAGVAWHGELLGAVAMRKLGMSDSGTTWCGVSIDCADVIDHAAAFCAETNWTGGFELELIREQATRVNYLIEINPRFPSWVFLGAAAGANLPALLVDAVAGVRAPAPPKVALPGKVFARTVVDIVRPLSTLADFILEGHKP